jgi:hypothetical protein
LDGVENITSLPIKFSVSIQHGNRSFSSQLREKDSIDDPLLPFLAEVNMYDLQGKFHSFGWSYANIATSLMGGPLVMCRSGRSAKDAFFRLGACPLLLLLSPLRRFPNSIAMSNPNLKTRDALQRCTPSFCVTIETPDAGSKEGGGCVAGE